MVFGQTMSSTSSPTPGRITILSYLSGTASNTTYYQDKFTGVGGGFYTFNMGHHPPNPALFLSLKNNNAKVLIIFSNILKIPNIS